MSMHDGCVFAIFVSICYMFYVLHEYDEICTNLDDIGNVGQLP